MGLKIWTDGIAEFQLNLLHYVVSGDQIPTAYLSSVTADVGLRSNSTSETCFDKSSNLCIVNKVNFCINGIQPVSDILHNYEKEIVYQVFSSLAGNRHIKTSNVSLCEVI